MFVCSRQYKTGVSHWCSFKDEQISRKRSVSWEWPLFYLLKPPPGSFLACRVKSIPLPLLKIQSISGLADKKGASNKQCYVLYAFKFTLYVSAGLAVRWLVGNCNMFARGACFPQGHPVQLPWRNGPSHQQKQQAPGWSLDGWFQRFLLYHITRYRAVAPPLDRFYLLRASFLQVLKVLGIM